MIDFAETLKDSGLESDPNGIIARLVRSSNNYEKDVTKLDTQIIDMKTEVGGLKESVTNLEEKNRTTHNSNRDHKENAADELDRFRDESKLKLKEVNDEKTTLSTRIMELESERDEKDVLSKDLQGRFDTVSSSLLVHENAELTRSRRKFLGTIESPIREGLENTVFGKIEHLLIAKKEGKGFDLRDSNGKSLKNADGNLIEVSDLINDVNTKNPKWASEGLPGAFIEQDKESNLQNQGNLQGSENSDTGTTSGVDIRAKSREGRK